ncbi:hypothetical protein H7F16_11390 [Gemmobacter straminiformis]|uniref:Uncharacterized protein n=2 Tax=Paragemmobacter straminiformis TaxID=2045119 RepID=A0A842I8D9_9RHOB|nr:hypothetical protein [Gemmobacter straminiformis]
MGLLFGVGTMLVALVFVVRLVPKLFGLALWLGSAGASAGAAFFLIYLYAKGSF